MKNIVKFIVIISCVPQLISAGPCLSKMAKPESPRSLAAQAAAEKEHKKARAAQAKENDLYTYRRLVPDMPGADRVALGHAMQTHLPVAQVWNIIFEYMKDFNPSVVRTFYTDEFDAYEREAHTMHAMSDKEFITIGKPRNPTRDMSNRKWRVDIHLWHVDEDLPTKTFVQELPESVAWGRHLTCGNSIDIVPLDQDRFMIYGERNTYIRHKNEAKVIHEMAYDNSVSIKKIISLSGGNIAGIVQFSGSNAKLILANLDGHARSEYDLFSGTAQFESGLWGMAKMNDRQLLVSCYGTVDGKRKSAMLLKDMVTGKNVKIFETDDVHYIHPLDGHYFLTAYSTPIITLWHKDCELPVRTFEESQESMSVWQRPRGSVAVIDEN